MKATVIRGNPDLIDGNVKADEFYSALEAVLRDRGVDVTSDAGAPHTVPEDGSDMWLGHSRGGDRLEYAPEGVRTLHVDPLQSPDALDADGNPTDSHYEVTPELIAAVEAMI